MNNWEELSALADNQMEATAAADMRKAIEADPSLKSQYESILSLKRSLRNDLPDHDSPHTLSLCLDRIRELDRVGRTENIVHKFRYAIASGLAMLIVGAAVFNQTGSGDVMDNNTIARSLSAGLHGGSRPVQSEGLAADWLRSHMEIGPIGNGVLERVRAEQLIIDGRPVGRYFLTDGTSTFVYLITPGVAQCDGTDVPGYQGLKQSRFDNMNLISWCENNVSFVLASERPVSEMLQYFVERR